MDILGLAEHIGRRVLLAYLNGEWVEVRLLGFDPQVHGDLTYDVLRVLDAGDPPAPGSQEGVCCLGSTDDLLAWSPLGD